MPVITNIEDLRQVARRKLPKAIFEYVDHGSYDQVSLAANRDDLKAIRFRQRVLINADNRQLATTMLGEKVAMPIAIAPTGLTGLLRGNGEMLAARAAEAAGIRFCLSTMSICSIEDVREATKAPFWFQLYVFRDRGFSESVIERAKAAGCTALFEPSTCRCAASAIATSRTGWKYRRGSPREMPLILPPSRPGR